MVGSGGFVSFSSAFSPVAAIDDTLPGNVLLGRAFVSAAPSSPDLASRCASTLRKDSDTDLLVANCLVRAIFVVSVVRSAARGLDVDRLLRDSAMVSSGSGLLASGREVRGRGEVSAAGRCSV